MYYTRSDIFAGDRISYKYKVIIIVIIIIVFNMSIITRSMALSKPGQMTHRRAERELNVDGAVRQCNSRTKDSRYDSAPDSGLD